MGQITQDNRSISITNASVAKDTLLLTGFNGSEHVSDLFQFQIEAVSEDLNLTPEQFVGKVATIAIHTDKRRYFNGYISHFAFGGLLEHNLRQYTLTMVPWLWFTGKTNNHRIFQEKNTKEIVSAIFKDLGFTDFDFKATGGNKREYCIQHNESDLHFISRLLEEDGIAYYFKHEQDKHMMVIVDQKNTYEDCDQSVVEFSNEAMGGIQLNSWQHEYNFQKGQWSINDYNFKQPAKDLLANTKTSSKFANNSKFEHYEYPDLYDTTAGSELVKIKMEAEEVSVNMANADGNCASFYAGGKFKLEKHPSKSENGVYIILGITHIAQENSYKHSGSVGGNENSHHYSNSFTCIPADVHFRPIQVHERPVMKGPQSALVVGPKGEEIYIDEFGRIKVQFIWDREGKKDENTTCFIRVMQSWAGNGWGTSFIPRMGHEVIVNFLDGDPDRPIVTGSVYNGKNKIVYPSKTQSGIKTRSTKKGTTENYNELRFEDKKGEEQIYIHAEKNMDTRVENDETLTVDHDRTKIIKNDETSTIVHDRRKTVNNDQWETIDGNKVIKVTGTAKSGSVGNHTETIKNNQTINIGKIYSLTAGDKIELITGKSSITMTEDGTIVIKGVDISVIGSGEINIKAKQNVVIKGKKILEN